MGPYFTDAGPDDGILVHRDVTGSIEVFEDSRRSIPIGTARCIGWDSAGSAVWRLDVRDGEAEGPWVVVDREFLSTRPDWRDLYRTDAQHELNRPRRSFHAGRTRPTGRPGNRPGAPIGDQPSPS